MSKSLIDYAENPIVVASRKPLFSWQVDLEGRGRKQSAYQILVATSEDLLLPGKADMWDSGKVESDQSLNIEYSGKELSSNMDCWWTVKYWDENSNSKGFSESQYFGTPLFEQSDWKAEWIGMGPADEPYSDPTVFQRDLVSPEIKSIEPDPRSPYMRKKFSLEKTIKRARAYVSGLGLFELHLNGNKIGDDVLSTPRTDFVQRILYSTYDITEQLIEGKNAIGIILGNGWFNGQKRYWGWQNQWYGSPKAIVQLEIEFEDGSKQQIFSDGSWKGDWSPITFNCIYDGEHYDARLEQPGWTTPEFDDKHWNPVNLVPDPQGKLQPMMHEKGMIVEEITPVSVAKPEPGTFVFDMGKNITGWIRLRIKGGNAGDIVKMHFGEAQYEDGSLNFSSNNAAHQKDEYTLKGNGDEVFEPRFTFHGFQYVEIKGYPGTPGIHDVTGCFERTAVAQTGNFECGNDLINNIHQCTLQSQLCNVQMGVPTDDTQRPERLGWGADAWATACEALYNLEMPRVYRKWIQDFCDQQDEESGMVGMIAPQAGSEEDLVWTTAFVIIPWWQYLHCGDHRILEDCYSELKKYMDFLKKTGVNKIETVKSEDIINTKILWRCGMENRFPAKEDSGHLQISQWGDHLSTSEGFVTRSNMPLSIATAFYYLDVSTMAKISEVLGKSDDAREYAKLAEEIKAAYNERFFDPEVGYYDTGTQSAQAWALAFGLVPEEEIKRVENYFTTMVSEKQRGLTTGYAGTKFAINALSDLGHDDIVWKLATKTDYPSWGFMLRLNRTTSCEQWNGERGSLNHAPLAAAIDEWFYSGLAGIKSDPSGPGFEKIIFKPYIPEDLPWVKASIKTPRGKISSAWQREGKTVKLSLTVPANSTATVYIPADTANITENEKPVVESTDIKLLETEVGISSFAIGSGTYQFTFQG